MDKLQGASWIGKRAKWGNPMSLHKYTYSLSYRLISGSAAQIVFAARNKDNYLSVRMDHATGRLTVSYVCDNAWENKLPMVETLKEFPIDNIQPVNDVRLSVCDRFLTIEYNNKIISDSDEILPPQDPFMPYNKRLMLIGFRQPGSSVEYSNICVDDTPVSDACLLPLGEVCGGKVTVTDEFELTSIDPCIMVRKSVFIKGTVRHAVLYASAGGFYNPYINGSKIENRYFAPGFTDYRLRIAYQKYDITSKLIQGENEISAHIGSGYYSGFAGYNSHADIYGKGISFIAKICIEYENGETEDIATDSSWEVSENSPIMYADCLQGEYYDSRMTDHIKYRPSEIIPSPQKPVPTNGQRDDLMFTMEENTIVAPREVARFVGACTSQNDDRIVFDMSQNIVGTVCVKLRGKRDLGIKIRYGEICTRSGELYVANLRSAANTDVYILSGSESECFIPDLTFHGFRYVEISGNGCSLKDIDIESVEGIVISDMDEVTGSFECSNELVDKLYSNSVWGQRDNFLLIPTDCPQRNERMGWTGDAQAFVRTAAYNMNIYNFMRKWLKDLREAQIMYNKNGSVPDIAPLCGDNRGGCAGWGDASVIVPWELYMAYGKKEILEENYEMMCAWVDFQNSPQNRYNGLRTVNGTQVPEQSDLSHTAYIQIQQRRGDHLAYDHSTPFILSATAYAAYSASLLSRTAAVLEKKEDEKKYLDLSDKIKRSFCEAWVQDDGTLAYWGEMSVDDVNNTYFSDVKGSVHHPSQTAYALAIDFDIIDVKKYPRAAECFKRTFTSRNNRIFGGFLGIAHFAPALMKCGCADTAFDLLTQEECPGWLYSVKNGATTIWERWNSYDAKTDTIADRSMNSFNHYTYGAIGQWLYSDVLGIQPSAPGYSSVELKPHYGGLLAYAKGSYITPHGEIYSSWRLDRGKFIYECKVPDGINARLTMPDGSVYDVTKYICCECDAVSK